MSYLHDAVVPAIRAAGLETIFEYPDHNFDWKKAGDRWRGACPFHDSKSGTALHIYTDSLYWNCPGCPDERVAGKTIGGDPIKFLAWCDGVFHGGQLAWDIYSQYQAQVCELVGLERRELTDEEKAGQREVASYREFLELLYTMSRKRLANHPKARDYLLGRGLTVEAIELLELGVLPPRDAIISQLREAGFDVELPFVDKALGVFRGHCERYCSFPWRDEYGRPLTCYGDLWDRDSSLTKKVALANLRADQPSKRSPYLFDQALRSGATSLTIVEGITDAAVCHANGLTNVVACVAAQLSKEQAQAIGRHGITSCTIQLDPDPAGSSGTASCITSLVANKVVPYVPEQLPDGLDPDDFIKRDGVEALEAHLQKAVPGIVWQLNCELAGRKFAELSAIGQVEFMAMARELCAAWSVDDKYVDKLVKEYLLNVTGMKPGELREAMKGSGQSSQRASQFEMDDSGIYFYRQTANGPTRERLTNFSAQITSDDYLLGAGELEDAREFELACHLEGREYRFSISAADFSRMSWPIDKMGSRAIVTAGYASHARAQQAIQEFSHKTSHRHIYQETGWREIGGKSVYLHHGGAISKPGNNPNVLVRLADRLANYEFPDIPSGVELQQAIQTSLAMLALNPPEVMVPMLATVYRAPLGAVDFCLQLYGITGAFKSEMSALMQQHWGPKMSRKALPETWQSTITFIMMRSHKVKDAVFAIDDMVDDGGSRYGLMEKVASAIRSAGNQAGRGRATRDLRERAGLYPRGALVLTGEQKPRGESVGARMMTIQVPLDGSTEQKAALTQCQADASRGEYAAAMAAYVQWLAGRGPASHLAKEVACKVVSLRESVPDGLSHQRLVEIACSLRVGWEMFLEFAAEVGAIDETRHIELVELGREAIMDAAGNQEDIQRGENTAGRVIELIVEGFDSLAIHLADHDDPSQPPDRHELWGWPEFGPASGRRVGTYDKLEQVVHLLPETITGFIHHLSDQGGRPIRFTAPELKHLLKEAGLLLKVGDSGQWSKRIRLDGKRTRVWSIPGEKIRIELSLDSLL